MVNGGSILKNSSFIHESLVLACSVKCMYSFLFTALAGIRNLNFFVLFFVFIFSHVFLLHLSPQCKITLCIES